MNDSHRKLKADMLKELAKSKENNEDVQQKYIEVAQKNNLPLRHPLIQQIQKELK